MRWFFKTFLVFALFFSLNTKAYEETKKEEEISNSTKIPVSTGKYITGGVLGSALGFGIGHGVQGRYSQKGWIYTVGEVAGFSIFANNLSKCFNDSLDKGCQGNTASQVYAGMALFIGFRVWEIVDVWTGARPVDQESVFFILPLKDQTTLGFTYRF